jgi:hypothetical protein
MNKRGNLVEGEFLKNNAGQVWVETVIYLLIAFVMMGLILSFIKPKIEELRDKAIIEQSVEIINDIDNLIVNIGSPGNKRLVEVGIKKGSLIIDSEKDIILFEINSAYGPSEEGGAIQLGNIQETTIRTGKIYRVTLERNFSEEYNITYKNQESMKTLGKTSVPYRLFFTNEGELSNKIKINFDTE